MISNWQLRDAKETLGPRFFSGSSLAQFGLVTMFYVEVCQSLHEERPTSKDLKSEGKVVAS
jgi:hypothetical protein